MRMGPSRPTKAPPCTCHAYAWSPCPGVRQIAAVFRRQHLIFAVEFAKETIAGGNVLQLAAHSVWSDLLASAVGGRDLGTGVNAKVDVALTPYCGDCRRAIRGESVRPFAAIRPVEPPRRPAKDG
jgi:hypothetical protein